MKTALIACGALAREVIALNEKHAWGAEVWAVPALLHNRPEGIPGAVQARIREARENFDRVVVIYGDCGTGGRLDALLEAEGVQRLAGPHCFEMYAGDHFDRWMAQELGSFFLTDFLVSQFDQLVIAELGLDRFPQLRDDYFAHYTRAVYLAQRPDPVLYAKAERAAQALNLPLEIKQVGYGALESRLLSLMQA